MSRRADADWLSRAEWAFTVAVTAILVVLHFRFFFSAGGFWRDEADSLNVAGFSSLGQIWTNMHSQSFPILWFVVLRSWIGSGIGHTEPGIRVLGLVIGVGILAVLGRNARAFGHSIPFAALTLLGFNAAVLRYGDSIRGHGLGMLTGLLTLGLVWQAALAPTPWRAVAAALASVAAVQSLYFNVVLVLAACAGGIAVALRRKSPRSAAVVLLVGIAGAISLAPYWQTIQNRRAWGGVFRISLDLPQIWARLADSFASTAESILWVWIALAALAVAAASCALLFGSFGGAQESEREASAYCSAAILVGLPAYFVLLKVFGHHTHPWYYVALMALVAGCLDAPLALLVRTKWTRVVRLMAAGALVGLLMLPMWRSARTRNTNVDLVAGRLGTLAAAGDLVVIDPWYLSISFDRYYRGPAGRVTVPPMPASPIQQYDALKQAMTSSGAMASVLDAMRTSLREGHRVFWVGDLFMPRRGMVPGEPPPAPHPLYGWNDSFYYQAWGLQAGYLIQRHATSAEQIEVPESQAVNPFEYARLYVFSGWWEGASPQ